SPKARSVSWDVEQVEPLWREISQIFDLPSRELGNSLGVTLRGNDKMFAEGYLPELVTRYHPIAVKRQPKFHFARDQKHRNRKLMGLEICQLICNRPC